MTASRKKKSQKLELDWDIVPRHQLPPQWTQPSSASSTSQVFSKRMVPGEVYFLKEKNDVDKNLHERLYCPETAFGHPVVLLSAADADGLVEVLTVCWLPSASPKLPSIR